MHIIYYYLNFKNFISPSMQLFLILSAKSPSVSRGKWRHCIGSFRNVHLSCYLSRSLIFKENPGGNRTRSILNNLTAFSWKLFIGCRNPCLIHIFRKYAIESGNFHETKTILERTLLIEHTPETGRKKDEGNTNI